MRGLAATFDQPTEFKIFKWTPLIAQVTLSYNWKYIGLQQHGKKEPVSTNSRSESKCAVGFKGLKISAEGKIKG
jgi:hypothetical protein